MEATIDAIIERLDTLKDTPEFQEVMQIGTSAWFDDPGMVHVDDFPYFFVQPMGETPASETMGLSGWDVRTLEINVVLMVHVPSYFDPDTKDDDASRKMVRAMNLVRKTLRQKSNISLAGTVRRVQVANINYMPNMVDEGVYVRMAVMTLLVQKQYQHEA